MHFSCDFDFFSGNSFTSRYPASRSIDWYQIETHPTGSKHLTALAPWGTSALPPLNYPRWGKLANTYIGEMYGGLEMITSKTSSARKCPSNKSPRRNRIWSQQRCSADALISPAWIFHLRKRTSEGDRQTFTSCFDFQYRLFWKSNRFDRFSVSKIHWPVVFPG